MHLRQNLLYIALIGLLLPLGFSQETPPAYRNPNLPAEQRAADLVKRMTLEEKVDQIAGGRRRARNSENPEEKQAFEALDKLYREDSQVSPHDAAEARNKAQHFLVEKTRLGIPAIFMGEALHGFMAYGSTSFPQVLGLASTWDPELVQQAFTAAGDEMASSGVNQAFTPVLDLARDPRWGRTEETYGEDPYLVSRMGVAAINGLQGTSWMIDRHHVMATMKHFAAHGQPESGTNTAPANFSERDLRETFLVPFPRRRARSPCRKRDGFVQRNRRHSLARQPLAAGPRPAPGMGLPRLRHFRRRRPADAGRDSPCRRRFCRSRSQGTGRGRGLRSVGRLGLRHVASSRSATARFLRPNWIRPCSACSRPSSVSACSRIPTSIPTTHRRSRTALSISNWR